MLPSVTTTTHQSFALAKRASRTLYKQWLRAAPEICDIYKLEIDARTVQRRVRQEWEKNRFIRDLNMIDILLFKGRAELEETMNIWKQPTHVMRFFQDPLQEPKPVDFMSKFYADS
ncbi:NADH dehydrogenase 1 alpha subcomplex subunit 6 ndufa6 [Kappamyces sp. JEL0680]|nr:NADH dehydrogenase 1 alpha subcomplex subunit 6 ndufa6 [Kappamyces sp. JEL0680]